MVAKAADLDGTAMSWEEYDALGEIRAEYIDGRVVMAPSPMRRHQSACRRLANLLESAIETRLSTSPVRDLVVKMNKYAAYALDRYWVLDPEKREMYVFARQNAMYELFQTVSREPADVDFGAGVALIDPVAIVPAD